jgi:DNA invertase Pin-like site-specific DNA recombinase
MRVALYARRSQPPKGWKPSYPGEDPEGSTQAQMKRLEKWAGDNGHESALKETDTATGRNPHRPGWERVIAAVRGGHVQAVAITKTSRAMRNTIHYLTTVEQDFLPRGCYLEVLDQPMATVRGKGDPMAVAFRTVAAAFNQLELDLAREASMEVMERREDGRLYGPRSERPSGRPSEYGEGHKFRVRGGRREHDRARCQACRGETGATSA